MVDKTRLYNDINFLTTINPPRNYQNLVSLELCADYIDDEFKKIGLITERQKFTALNKDYENIICSYGANKNKRLIVGAHYDVAGDHPGADDNASGISGILELARLIGVNKPMLDYQIDFIAYCLEEPPFFGSKLMGSSIHAKSLVDSIDKIIGMICLDMIGFYSNEPNSQKKISQKQDFDIPDIANFIAIVGIKSQENFVQNIYNLLSSNSETDVRVALFEKNSGLAAFSDHRNYWKIDINAVMITDTAMLRNSNYHTKQDTIETLDFDKMSGVIQGVYNAITNLTIDK